MSTAVNAVLVRLADDRCADGLSREGGECTHDVPEVYLVCHILVGELRFGAGVHCRFTSGTVGNRRDDNKIQRPWACVS
jgi:hypothetical protein